MTKSKAVSKSAYHGRHRPGTQPAAPAGRTPSAPVSPASPPAPVGVVERTTLGYDAPSVPPAPAAPSPPPITPAAPQPGVPARPGQPGRHRAPQGQRPHGVPRFAGTGLLLPGAAAATLVLTATGAHLGSSAFGSSALRFSSASAAALSPSAAAAATSPSASATQGDQSAQAQSLAAQRYAADRADRDAAREKAAAISAETARRSKVEASLAHQAPLAITTTATSHAWVPYLDAPYTLTSGFGMRWGALHPGQDFAVPVGTPVMAMSSGTVIFAGWSGGYGNKMEIQYWDGTISWMAHNSVLKVKKGDAVTPGEVVALSGNTGHSTGPHSHLEIHLGGDETNTGAIPPIPWLTAKGIMPGKGGGARTGSDQPVAASR